MSTTIKGFLYLIFILSLLITASSIVILIGWLVSILFHYDLGIIFNHCVVTTPSTGACYSDFVYFVSQSGYAPLLSIPLIITLIGFWKLKLPIFKEK